MRTHKLLFPRERGVLLSSSSHRWPRIIPSSNPRVRWFGRLSHVDQSDPGYPQMVDVSDKPPTWRFATARGLVWLPQDLVKELRRQQQEQHHHPAEQDSKGSADWLLSSKGPVISTAIVAGVQGAKQTSNLIPFCHSINMTNCSINVRFLDDSSNLEVVCTAHAKDATGVEMEALTGVSVASLTIYDMLKSLSKTIRIHSIELTEKQGGKSGHYEK